MPTPKLPKTNVQLSTSLSFFVLREDAISLKAFFQDIFAPRSSLTEVQKKMKPIRGVISFQEVEERVTQSRWEIDSNVLGEPLEALIGPVDRTFTLRRHVFYGSDIISEFGYEDELTPRAFGTRLSSIEQSSILAQQLRSPFILIKVESVPEGINAATLTTFFRGCTFARLSRVYGVESPDVAVAEDALIRYAGKQQFKS